ncbi:iron transporter [Roseomonas frigidaquae]|uniref:Iron transporter n=1 Tax=Falsiroseomonas frigidaquae TaxID=487318 RepID=A0ABX1F780_9PROT|nr:VIT1/CCC1 transporter family protein [Falsiroseomonas frigidaquae]NKE48243.1 iron transporter [Falsiroseomonas frigidaquae]
MQTANAPTLEPTRDGLPPMPPGPPHEELHFAAVAPVREVVAGAAQGLVLPFAVTAAMAGLGAAPSQTILAGLAAAAAGAASAGLGHALAARDAAARYQAERVREEEESHLYPDRERWEVAAILHRYGVRGQLLRQAVEAIASDRRRWVDFMMRFELDLSEPDPGRAARSATILAVAQVVAGLLPVLPHALAAPGAALGWSAALTAAALVGLGWLKARSEGLPPLRGAVQAVALGGAAAAAAWSLAAALA